MWNDLAAICRLKNQEEDEVQRWFHAHVDPLFAFIYGRVRRDRETARDVTQAVFDTALRQLDRFDPDRGSMMTWLRILSLNHIQRELRHKRRELPLLDAELQAHWQAVDTADLPPDALLRHETCDLVRGTMLLLPEHYQSVLRGHYLEEHSLADLARQQSRPHPAIKSLLHRARTAFREEFSRLSRLEAL